MTPSERNKLNPKANRLKTEMSDREATAWIIAGVCLLVLFVYGAIEVTGDIKNQAEVNLNNTITSAFNNGTLVGMQYVAYQQTTTGNIILMNNTNGIVTIPLNQLCGGQK